MKLFRKTKIVKIINYKGFKLSVINNCAYNFKYEYQIEAITKQNKYVLKKKIKRIKKLINQRFDIVYDPTSNITKEDAIYFGKININELRFRMSCPALKYV